MRDAKPLAGSPDAAARERARGAGAALASIEARRIVLVDGVFMPDMSDLTGLEAGLTIGSLAQALAQGDERSFLSSARSCRATTSRSPSTLSWATAW